MKQKKISAGFTRSRQEKKKNSILIITLLVLFAIGTYVADDKTAYDLKTKAEIEAETEEKTTVEYCVNSTKLQSTNFEREYPQKIVDVPLDPIMQGWLFDYCEYQEISPYIIIAMIEVESSFNPNAKNFDESCLGLMQVNEYYHSGKLGMTDLYNPYQNIMVGIEVLKNYLGHNSLEWALTAYNGGADYADSMNGTSEYARTIIERAGELAHE